MTGIPLVLVQDGHEIYIVPNSTKFVNYLQISNYKDNQS